MGDIYKIRLKVGDTVMVRSGKYKGRSGKITAVHRTTNKVTVEGVNVVKRHRKPTQRHPQGTVAEVTRPLPVSKVGILDTTAKRPSRIVFKSTPRGGKVRVVKTSGKEIK